MKETANKRAFDFLNYNVRDLYWYADDFNSKLQRYYLSIQECIGFFETLNDLLKNYVNNTIYYPARMFEKE